MLEPLVRWWTTTYQLLIKVPIVGSLQFDGLRDVDMRLSEDGGRDDRPGARSGSFPTIRLDRERRDTWANDSLEAILPAARPGAAAALRGRV